MEKEKFGNKYYYPTLWSRISFEIKSIIGRLFSRSEIITKKRLFRARSLYQGS